MQEIVFFIEQIAPGIYILCALGILLNIRAYFMAQNLLGNAQFELEKELARYRLSNALTLMVVLAEIALAALATAQVVAPTLRIQPPQTIRLVEQVQETPFFTRVPGAATTGTPGPTFAQGVEIPGLDTGNLSPFATPTLTPTPVGTIIPDVPPAVGCNTPNAYLIVPANGMVLFEATNVIGSATIDNFAFYRFELNGPSTNNAWAHLADYTVPVTDGELGQIIPSRLIPGEHRFRLTVFDIYNELRASCMVVIFISQPLPTATPLSGN